MVVSRKAILDAFGINKPINPKPISADVPVQRAGAFVTVEVDLISVGNNAEFVNIQVRVRALKRIERPGNVFEAALDGAAEAPCTSPATYANLADGAQIPNNDPKLTILHRVKALDGVTPLPAAAQTEVKQWEAMGSFTRALGTIPARYDKTNAATKIPRRAVCVGPNAVNGVCSH